MSVTIKPDKLVEPKEPQFKDFPKVDGPTRPNSPYVIAYSKYQKDMRTYKAALIVEEQTKFIKDVQRSSLQLCLKKYFITKQ